MLMNGSTEYGKPVLLACTACSGFTSAATVTYSSLVCKPPVSDSHVARGVSHAQVGMQKPSILYLSYLLSDHLQTSHLCVFSRLVYGRAEQHLPCAHPEEDLIDPWSNEQGIHIKVPHQRHAQHQRCHLSRLDIAVVPNMGRKLVSAITVITALCLQCAAHAEPGIGNWFSNLLPDKPFCKYSAQFTYNFSTRYFVELNLPGMPAELCDDGDQGLMGSIVSYCNGYQRDSMPGARMRLETDAPDWGGLSSLSCDKKCRIRMTCRLTKDLWIRLVYWMS